MSLDACRYSKVSRRIWVDARFQSLSQPKPCGAWLFMRLLTAPELNTLPGLFHAWQAGLAQSLGWAPKAFANAFAELEEQGLGRADWKRGLVWIPNSIKHNEPSNPNIVVSWRGVAKELPECELLDEALEGFAAYLREMGPEWIGAWELAECRGDRTQRIPPGTRSIVQERDGDACSYCEVTVNWKDRRGPKGATYDHVDPNGGAAPSNIVIACRSCNSRKGFRTLAGSGFRLRLGHDLGPTQVAPGNQDQDQKQDPEQKQELGSRPAPTAAAHVPIRIPMQAAWQPTEPVLQSFDVALIPRWATDQLIARFRTHFCANHQDIRTEAEWNQACSKWVFKDWGNPSRRPSRPAETPANGADPSFAAAAAQRQIRETFGDQP